jgi:arginyl-tRNA synthetase
VIAPRVCEAIAVAFGSEFSGTDPVLRPSQFADVQANAALALAKRIGLPPREVAGRILDHLDLDDLCSHIGVSGPGFLNLTLREEWIEAAVSAMASDERLGVPLERRSASRSTTPRRTWRRRRMWVTCVPRWSVMPLHWILETSGSS